MSVPRMIGALLLVASLSTLALGDPLTILTLDTAIATTKSNDYFDPWSVEILNTKKNSMVTVNVPTNVELSPTMQIKITYQLSGDEPGEYVISICDALDNPSVRSIMNQSGRPADTFPKTCPVGPGNWTMFEIKLPTDLIPSTFPDGSFSGSYMILEEGEPPYVQIDFTGRLSHDRLPLGR